MRVPDASERINLDILKNYAEFEAFARSLPSCSAYTRNELLHPSQHLYNDGSLEIYYAPTDHINRAARIIFLGITPGWQQMEQFYRTARTEILEGKQREGCLKSAKQQSAFFGSMRNNLITMLDDLNLPKVLNIESSASLFDDNRDLIHTASAIRYPVFVRQANYTGYSPMPLRHSALLQIIRELLLPELQQVSNALIIPLGNAVSQVLEYLIKQTLLTPERCCYGLPHPSGANGHRLRHFQENRKILRWQIDCWFRTHSHDI